MTAAILVAKAGLIDLQRLLRRVVTRRALVLLALGLLAWYSPAAGWIIVEAMASAYLQVSVFVAATLLLIYGAERFFRIDFGDLLQRHRRAQVPIAALLGATPGCGGAIVVVTQFTRGYISFGALIAVLCGTMGDAAFLLLSQQPLVGLGVISTCMVTGAICGYAVDRVHGPGFMRMQTAAVSNETARRARAEAAMAQRRARQSVALHPLWIALLLPGVILAVPIAMQLDPNTWFGSLAVYQPVTWLGFAGALLALLMWVGGLSADPGQVVGARHAATHPADHGTGSARLTSRVVNDTNFVTVWVGAAYLIFELGVYSTGIDLAQWFAGWMWLAPLIGVLVGFIPGCGPQIIVTTLYLAGVLPVSALLGNAIANDGDALFPAIALAPRAAIVATLYSGIPALIVAYGAYLVGL